MISIRSGTPTPHLLQEPQQPWGAGFPDTPSFQGNDCDFGVGGSLIREHVAHFFMSESGSNIHERVAQKFVDIQIFGLMYYEGS